ncbi:hypothetical protein Tco_0321001 [Tanacetum coccineum]
MVRDNKQKVTGIQELDELEERINNVEAIYFKLRDIKVKQKEVIIISDDEKSLDAPKMTHEKEPKLVDVPKQTHEEEATSLDVPVHTMEQEAKPLDVVNPHPATFSSSRGFNTRCAANYALR